MQNEFRSKNSIDFFQLWDSMVIRWYNLQLILLRTIAMNYVYYHHHDVMMSNAITI